jgi:predicted nucleotidyltransferase component of viral defense system
VSTGTPSNLSASLRARLKNRADELGLDFNQVLQYYAMERFLYRLSRSDWADRLIVKGAAMLRVWDGAVARPTRDIDFLGRIENTPEAVAEMVRGCLAVESADGLEFSSRFEVEPITVEERYPGVRAVIEVSLAGARMRLQLDIGVSDAVVPEPGWVDYPTLLDMEAPRILAYQPATSVAEKLEAMASKGLLNSRLKDYYDIWMLSRSVRFEGAVLKDSIVATFGQRGTVIPASRPAVLSEEYARQPERVTQWAAFVKRLKTSGIEAPSNLGEVVDVVAEFIMPAAAAAAAGESFEFVWQLGSGWSPSDR